MSCHWYIYLHFKKYEIIINSPLEQGTHVVLDSGDIFLWFSFHHFGSVNLFERHLVFPQSLGNNSLFFLESYVHHSRAHWVPTFWPWWNSNMRLFSGLRASGNSVNLFLFFFTPYKLYGNGYLLRVLYEKPEEQRSYSEIARWFEWWQIELFWFWSNNNAFSMCNIFGFSEQLHMYYLIVTSPKPRSMHIECYLSPFLR